MEHRTQVAIGRELLQWLDEGRTYVAPEQMRNPVQSYLSRPQFERERVRIFRRLPLVVGLAAEVSAPGDFLTNDDTAVPIVVVRDEHGELNAFVNACRHRGTLLLDARCGHSDGRFVCPYHHWSYGHDGALAAVPMEFGFPGLDRAAHALVRLPVRERFGLVWVQPSPGAPLDLDDYLGEELARELDGFGFDTYVHFRSTLIPSRMNWKLMYDTFLEFYHGYFTHADTLRHLLARNLCHFEPLGNHYRMVAAKRTIGTLKEQPEHEWNLLDHAIVSYSIFPNLAINYHGDHVAMYRVFPEGDRHDAARWYFSMLLPRPATAEKAARYFEKNFEYIVRTGNEDVDVGERIQRTLSSGANESMLFGGFEPMLTWFHTRVAELAGESATGAIIGDSAPLASKQRD